MIARLVTLVLLLFACSAHAADTAAPQTIVHILDYVAVDYSGAVENGKVTSEDEYKEMLEFTTQVVEQMKTLPSAPGRERLDAQAHALAKLVARKADAAQVAQIATALRGAIIDAYALRVAPTKAPDLKRAESLYAQQCAACHGAQGRGDGPAAKGMNPPPANFHDAERMAKRDRYGLYNTITLGVSGTPMQAYGSLPEDDRWGLAYYVASFTQGAPSPLSYARATLKQTVDAYAKGDHAKAQQLAVAAYLEGFELVEPALDAVDRDLRTAIERDMLKLRNLMRDRAPESEVQSLAGRISADLQTAQDKLGGTALSPGAAATSAFIILLREGLEAILVVAALIAFLVKAGRREALLYIHAGWIAALALGVLTWLVAATLIEISGATRELTEGVTALAAAAILLYAGFWLHDKSHARGWQRFIDRHMKDALQKGTLWAMAGLSFLAVYREAFETVLFYQALWQQAGEGAQSSILLGAAAGAAALAFVAWLILRFGIRLPLGMFFAACSTLMAVLAFAFTGHGVKALQEAGIVAASPLGDFSLPALGLYPTSQSLAAQAFVFVVICVAYFWMRGHSSRKEPA